MDTIFPRLYTMIILTIIFLLISGSVAGQSSGDQVYRPKVALVLSGGGAKGFAHIGFIHLVIQLRNWRISAKHRTGRLYFLMIFPGTTCRRMTGLFSRNICSLFISTRRKRSHCHRV